MLHKKLTFLFIILLLSGITNAQDKYQKGTIKLTNGDSIEAYIKVFDYNILQSTKTFEYKIDDLEEKIKAKKIQAIHLGEICYERAYQIEERSHSRENRMAIPDTTIFFVTRINKSEPPLFAHYSCSFPSLLNGGCNSGIYNYTTYYTNDSVKYYRLNEFYYSKSVDTDFENLPRYYSENLDAYIYFNKKKITPKKQSFGPGYTR